MREGDLSESGGRDRAATSGGGREPLSERLAHGRWWTLLRPHTVLSARGPLPEFLHLPHDTHFAVVFTVGIIWRQRVSP